jgi:hypothetical protein
MEYHMKFGSGFCFISPVSTMQKLMKELGNNHLALAHLVDSNDEYAAWFKTRSEYNDFIIMDNGAFELGGSYDPSKLLDLGHKCGATAIVLPDYPGESHNKTIDAALELAPVFKEHGFKTMMVPQSIHGDFEGWVTGYEIAAEHPDIDIIGMSILGIPTALPYIDRVFARVVMTELLIHTGRFAFEKHHHYLGLNSGPKLEIPSLLRMKALDTCDSSGPVWSAFHGIAYDDFTDSFMPCMKIKKPVDFDIEGPTPHQLSMIRHNIQMTNNLFTACHTTM